MVGRCTVWLGGVLCDMAVYCVVGRCIVCGPAVCCMLGLYTACYDGVLFG